MEKLETCECYNYAIKHEGETRTMIEAEPTLQALRTAREGLLAAAAVVEPRSPAFKLIEAGLKAVNGVVK